MKAWNAVYRDTEHEIKVAMTPEEWKIVVNLVWNYAEDLNETTVANFLVTLKKVGIEP